MRLEDDSSTPGSRDPREGKGFRGKEVPSVCLLVQILELVFGLGSLFVLGLVGFRVGVSVG